MSGLKGVYKTSKTNGDIYYRSSFTYRGKHISLGSYDTEEDAFKAYNEAVGLAYSDTPVDSYTPSCALPFIKWVVIINFRDNGLYIKTPIYLKNKMFFYYISPNDVYTFDADDLFFYSTHTIMKRGGHLFVADFGMQINIASRYGIRGYAVEGRDYYFANGDNHDYRYSNIIIINKYNGVQVRPCATGADSYTARIHINGDYIIGRYETETDAAIAYNKAADILASKGYEKNYQKNYIDTLSSDEYRLIYDSTDISKHILNIPSIRKDF